MSSSVPSPFPLTDGSLQIFNFVRVGQYAVTQLATSGWALGRLPDTRRDAEIGEVPPDPDSPSSCTPRRFGYWKNSGKRLKNQSRVATLDDHPQLVPGAVSDARM